ncbi:MAG TPA: hypothetical protein VJB57_07145 [Dehalococcoidia bacterium]|nr:hypothetical protein [Dehalococcoidia bacterium]
MTTPTQLAILRTALKRIEYQATHPDWRPYGGPRNTDWSHVGWAAEVAREALDAAQRPVDGP